MSLKNKIYSGVAWNATGLFIDNGFNYVIKLILARLLVPKAFGIIGLATIFMGMIQVLSDLGMSSALIQRKENDLNQIDYDTAYWAGIVWALILTAVLSLIVAPIAASFYNQEILKLIIPVLSIGIILSQLRTVHIVNITREMDFKRIVIPRNISNIFAGVVAITMALMGFGVWSLVFDGIAGKLLLVFIYSYVSPWKPRFRFSKASFKKIFNFGIYTSGTGMFTYLTNNIDYLLIGKLLGAQQLGLYTLGYNVTYVIRGQIMRVVNSVFYPVYSKLQDNLVAVKKYYFKVIKYNCVVIYPIMVGIILLSQPLVIYGLGEKWIGAIIPMQIMAGAGLIHLLARSNTVLLRGLGKPKLELIFSIIKTLGVNVPFIVLGIVYNGITGAAMGLLAAKFIIFFINNIILRKVAGIKFTEILSNAGGLFAVTLFAILFVFIIKNYLVLSLIYLLYLAIHLIISYADIKQIIILYRNKKGNKEIIKSYVN